MQETSEITPPAMGELTDTIHIDTSMIPDHVRDRLAAATLDLINGILKDPEASRRLRERQAARQARSAAAEIRA